MGDDSIIDFVMPLIIELVLICVIDILFIMFNLKKWLAQERIIKTFPSWKNTKKPFYWFVIWSVVKFVIDLAVILAFIFIFVDKYGLVMIAFGIGVWIVLTICQMGLYLLIENVIVTVFRKKNNKVINNTNSVITNESIDSDREHQD